MTQTVKAICLKTVDYMDNDKMLTLFSADNGKFGARIKGVRKAGAKLKFCAQPFCFGEYEIVETNGRIVVTNCYEIENFRAISNDLDAYYCGCVLLEFCSILLQEGEKDLQLFLLLLNCLRLLTSVSPKLVLVKFLLEGLKIAGYGLSFDVCNSCGKKIRDVSACLDLVEGGVACDGCKSSQFYSLTLAEVSCFNMIDETSFERLHVLKYDNRYDAMLSALAKYVETFVKKLNSIKFLF